MKDKGRLGRLIDIRELAAGLRKADLRAANGRVRVARERQEAIETGRDEAARSLTRVGESVASDLLATVMTLTEARVALREAVREIGARSREAERCAERVRGARRDVKALEVVRNRLRALDEAAERAKEQTATDDAAARMRRAI